LVWVSLCVLLARSSVVDAAQNAAVATNLSGSVAIQSAGGAIREVSSTLILRSGDAVLTGVNSFAVVSLADIGRVVLGPGTSAVTTFTGSSLQLSLRSGLACVQAQQTSLHATSGQLGLVPGTPSTIFDLSRTADQTEIAVYQGKVAATINAVEKGTYSTGMAAVSHAGQTLAPADIATVNADFSGLGCPDQSVVAAALPQPTPAPAHASSAGGIIAALLGLGAIAAAVGHGGGGGSPANTTPTVGPTVTPSPSPSVAPSPSPTSTVATPSPSPSATPTPTPTATPTSTPTATPTPSPTPTPSTAAGLTVAPQSLSFSNPLASPQQFTARDRAAHSFSAQSNDVLVAIVAESHHDGHSARFAVTPVGPGSTSIQVSDDQGNTNSLSVSVGGLSNAATRVRSAQPSLRVQPRELMLRAGASATLSVSEDGYSGAFHVTASQPNTVEARPASASGPTATFLVVAHGAGSASIRLTDERGGEAEIFVIVSKN
jgi:hypothetical protein